MKNKALDDRLMSVFFFDFGLDMTNTPNNTEILVFLNDSGTITVRVEIDGGYEGGYFFLPPDDLPYLIQELQKCQQALEKYRK